MTYVYKCNTCQREIEVVQKIDELAPVCCEVQMRKKIQAPIIKFVGQGFYVNEVKDGKDMGSKNK